MNVRKSSIQLHPDPSRALLRSFGFPEPRTSRIISRVLSLPEAEAARLSQEVCASFEPRHRNFVQYVLQRYEEAAAPLTLSVEEITRERKILIGSYFACEYTIEAAALFNPSIVWHPDQSGVGEGAKRFILSLRSTGEGHLSSISFRTGQISAEGIVEFDASRQFAETGVCRLGEPGSAPLYTLDFDPAAPLSERVLFPIHASESRGMEDARFVEFRDDSSVKYIATYTAYDGRTISPQLIETCDFTHFTITQFAGVEVEHKGFALFPRKIGGKYVMLSRQDNENNFIMFSDSLYQWDTKELIMEPKEPWEIVLIGNCGSPIETDRGWLVIHHGVGPMRTYTISAFLLDLEDPRRLIGRLAEPIVFTDKEDRNGYVPNAVYSCGSIIHNGRLILPYASADTVTRFATVDVNQLLDEMV